jgi:hypothetical protein
MNGGTAAWTVRGGVRIARPHGKREEMRNERITVLKPDAGSPRDPYWLSYVESEQKRGKPAR